MDKICVKDTMLALTDDELESSTREYLRFLREAMVIENEPIEIDELAQAKFQADLASGFEQPVHVAEAKLRTISELDFGPKEAVEPGAVVCVQGRHFAIGVSTARFFCDGTEMMGISTNAPFYAAIEGLKAGDVAEFNDREFEVRAVY